MRSTPTWRERVEDGLAGGVFTGVVVLVGTGDVGMALAFAVVFAFIYSGAR